MITSFQTSKEDAKLIMGIKAEAYDDENDRFGPKEDISSFWGSQWYDNLDENKRLIDNFRVYKIQADDHVIGTFWSEDEEDNSVVLKDFFRAVKKGIRL